MLLRFNSISVETQNETNQIIIPALLQSQATKPVSFNCHKTKHSEVRNCTSTVGRSKTSLQSKQTNSR